MTRMPFTTFVRHPALCLQPASSPITVLHYVDDQLNGSDPGAQALRKLARDVYALHNAVAIDALDTLSLLLYALASFV